MSKKLTTYQKLKQENDRLRKDIFFLVTDDGQYLEDKILTELKYKYYIVLERAFWN